MENLSDNELVESSLKGNKKHLELLIKRHNDYVFNICYRMLWNVSEAKDLTQEILISTITKLDSFKFNSSFTTWLYRIATNHTLNFIKAKKRNKVVSFDQYGENLDNTPDHELTGSMHNNIDDDILIEEVKQTCMSGMLMCLDTEYRMVFIIGEVMGFNDKIGSEMLDISPENFRMSLSRAKKELYNFMNNKCGLINKSNPCRCAKKTRSFIEAGYVNPDNLLFYPKHKTFIEQGAGEKQVEMEEFFFARYRDLFKQQTLLSNKDFTIELDKLLTSPEVRSLFNLQ